MSRRIILLIFIAGLAITFFLKPSPNTNEVLGMPNYTFVTRTPVPEPTDPPPPTATRKDDDDDDDDDGDTGGGNPPPVEATATPIPPTATPTNTPIPLIPIATPGGGFLATAVPCGVPPTIQTLSNIHVRSGPSTDNSVLGQLTYLETRYIIGRDADVAWWQIELANNETGWISDAYVRVRGNISGVPVVPEMPANEVPTWNPTPNPECEALPSPTANAIETAVIEPTETIIPEESTETATPEPEEPTVAEPENTPATTQTATATATSVIPTAEIMTAAENTNDEAKPAQPTAEPLDETEETPSAVSALPCASAMIGLAVIGFLTFRRIF